MLIVGAPGYVNRGQLLSYEYPATDFYLVKGIQCNLNIPESASTVYIEKGSNVTLDIPYLGVRTIPLDYDIDFGTTFLPFGMTPQGKLDFKDNGKLSYTLTKNGVDILGVDINIKVVPKDGYAFKCWMLNDDFRQKMGKAAKDQSERFSHEIITDKWEELLKELI